MSKPIKFFVDIPTWESLTPEQQEGPGYPITVGYDSIEDYFRHITAASPTALADEVVERVLAALEDKQEHGGGTDPGPEQKRKRRRKRAPPSDAALMTMEDFAPTVGFGKRMIEKFVAEGMPSVGDGHSRRVKVKEAQEWVIKRLQDGGSDVLHRARLDARKRGSK